MSNTTKHIALDGASGGGGGLASQQTLTATQGQTVFSISTVDPSFTFVYRLGHLLDASEFSLTASQLTLTSGAGAGDPITLLEFGADSGGGGGGGATTPITVDVAQSSHGFSAGQVLYNNSGTYALSKADLALTAEVVGLVSEVTDTDNFKLQSSGPFTLTAHGLGTSGSPLFLSESTGGLATTSEPGTGISKPVAYILDANTILVLIQRGSDVDGSSVNWVFPESNHTGNSSDTTFDHSALIGAESSIVVTVGNVIQSTTGYSVGNDGNGERKRVTLTYAPSTGVSVVIRSLGIPYNTPVSTGNEPWQITSSSHSAADGQWLMVNAGDAITFPASPSDNSVIHIGQASGDLSSSSVTIDGGTKNISDNITTEATTYSLDTNFMGNLTFVFKTTLDKWKVL